MSVPVSMEAWRIIISKLESYMLQTYNTKLVVINIDADPDPQRQHARYKETIESVMRSPMAKVVVVTSSLPAQGQIQEFIRYPFLDVEFRIEENGRAHTTGNPVNIQTLLA